MRGMGDSGLSTLLCCIGSYAARLPGGWDAGGAQRHMCCESSRSCYYRATSQSKHEDPGQCPLPAASDLWAAHRSGPGFAESSGLQIPPRAMIYGLLCLEQAETICLTACRARSHLATLLGQGWSEGLLPGRLEGMNQTFRNALRETHGGGGGSPRVPWLCRRSDTWSCRRAGGLAGAAWLRLLGMGTAVGCGR